MNHTFFDILSALGTLLAPAIALFIAFKDQLHPIDGTFIWQETEYYTPTLLIQNVSNSIVVLKDIKIKYGCKSIGIIDFSANPLYSKYVIIESKSLVKIPIEDRFLSFSEPSNKNKQIPLKVIIKPRKGFKSSSVQYYSYNELCNLGFCQNLFKDN